MLGRCIAGILASACATTALAAETPVLGLNALQLVDQRPDVERAGEIGSLWIWSCNYAVYRLGEQYGMPDSLRTLQVDLDKAYGDRIRGQRVIVEHYTLMVNGGQAETKISVGTGVATVLVPVGQQITVGTSTTHAKCSKEKTKFGWFDPSELKTPFTPIVGEATLNIGGERFSSRIVYSPLKQLSEGMYISGMAGTDADGEAVTGATRQLNDALMAEMARKLGQPPSAAPPP